DPEGPVVDALDERENHRIIRPSQVVLFRERSVLVIDGDREQPAAGSLPVLSLDVGQWLRQSPVQERTDWPFLVEDAGPVVEQAQAGMGPEGCRERPGELVIDTPALAGFDEAEAPLAEERRPVEGCDRADRRTADHEGVIDVPVAVFSATDSDAAG